MTEHDPNPVREEDGKFYWWDETWTERTGPYDTYEEAEQACVEYCKRCL